MIPILYSNDETEFAAEGLGRVPCLSCRVTEAINSIPECEFRVLATESIYPRIQLGTIIYCLHDESGDPQPYEVYAISEPLDDVVTFNARHIAIRLKNIVVEPYSANSVGGALNGLKTHAVTENPFNFTTTRETPVAFASKVPMSAKDLLGGVQGSILDVYGGEYEFDHFTVRMANRIGINSGVEIRYGSNLVKYKRDDDITDAYNAVVPYWTNEEGQAVVTLPEKYIVTGMVAPQYAIITASTGEDITDENGEAIEAAVSQIMYTPLDLTDKFETEPTVDQLRQAAYSYMNNNSPWKSKETITVDFVQLWQTGEYPQFENLQRVRLGDTVAVYYPDLNVAIESIRVVKTTYDSLLERYESMELGDKKSSLGSTLQSQITDYIQKNDELVNDVIKGAVENATKLITGEKGGNIVILTDADGKPKELLIMDTDDVATAQNVWRHNAAGWGHSSTGINGPYTLAATRDGSIVADMITAGTLNGAYFNCINLTATNVDITGKLTSVNEEHYINSYASLAGGELRFGRHSPRKVKADFFVTREQHLARIDESDVYLTLQASDNSGINLHSGNHYNIDDDIWKSINELSLRGETEDIVKIRYNGSATDILTNPNFWIQRNGSDYLAVFVNNGEINLEIAYNQGTDPENVTIDPQQGILRTIKTQVKSEGFYTAGNLTVEGTKNRAVQTEDYGKRLMYAYETASPFFGDIGEGVLNENGECVAWLDPVFAETIQTTQYQVFLQAYGDGACYVADRNSTCFTVRGTPGTAFGWELKAKQIDYTQKRHECYNDLSRNGNRDYAGDAINHMNNIMMQRGLK